MTAIHHTIIKAIAKAGAVIEESTDGTFILRNEDLMLRATSDDARELRALAQRWAEGEDTEDYQIEDLIDAIEEEAEEEDRAGSVVKPAYKRLYKEQGHPDNCGDWLATVIREMTRNGDDLFLEDNFIAIVEMNGITDWAKYLTDKTGTTGRMVMNSANRLRTIIRKSGVLHTPNGDMIPPAEFMKKQKI